MPDTNPDHDDPVARAFMVGVLSLAASVALGLAIAAAAILLGP